MMNGAREPDRFIRQIGALQIGTAAARVALAEDEIEHVEHRFEPLFAIGVGWHPKRHA